MSANVNNYLNAWKDFDNVRGVPLPCVTPEEAEELTAWQRLCAAGQQGAPDEQLQMREEHLNDLDARAK